MWGRLIENLEKKGYAVRRFATKEEAAAYLDGVIDGTTVGFGGSMTLEEMGLYEKLVEHNQVFWHWRVPEGKDPREMRDAARGTEIYLSSLNGISEDGVLINIDGTGNRVAEIFYGHKKVYLVVGINKLAPTEEEALFRARNIAAPLNAKRLAAETPCAAKGDRCYNCAAPGRICRGVSTFWEKPNGQAYEIVLVDEALGY